MDVDGVRSVVPFGVSEDKDTLAFQVVPTTGPADPATVETVHAVHLAAETFDRHTGTDTGLTGATVANIEISERLAGALAPYLLVVVGLSLLILTLVFRSLVVPLVATAGFLLSVGAAFGATVAVHQWGWFGGVLGVTQPGPLLSFMPIILIGVLFGLAMDYQMFLVSGMHEARAHGEDARTAVRSGLRPRRQGRHRRRRHHDVGLPRLRVLPPRDGAADRIRPRRGRSRGCRARADDAHAGAHAPARRARLVPPALARPAAARPRRRGRAARATARVG